MASFEAWKEKKREALRARAREKEAAVRKLQQTAEDSEQKKQLAEQVLRRDIPSETYINVYKYQPSYLLITRSP